MRRVVVTGLGATSPVGVGLRRSWNALLQGKSGLQSTKPLGGEFEKLQCQVAGLVPKGPAKDGAWDSEERFSRDEIRRLPLFMQYASATADEALLDSGWSPESDRDHELTGVCLGSGIGALEDVYETSLLYSSRGSKKVSPLFVPRLLINLAAGHISMKHGFKGPTHAATTACTTGAHSIGDAARFIQHGDADVMIAGGSESCIHPLAVVGFERSRSLAVSFNDDPHKASRPFSPDRDGFVIGEGCAVVVLEEMEHALERGARIYAEFAAYSATSDAHHLTQPPGDGNGAFRAMRRALQVAGLRPGDVSYISAHATSTKLGDIAETRAIAALMEDDSSGSSNHPRPSVSSTKGATGHLLGAAGAIETVFSVMALHENVVPPTANLEKIDPDLPKLNFVAQKSDCREVDVVLSNSFGFGGTNATLCFKRFHGP